MLVLVVWWGRGLWCVWCVCWLGGEVFEFFDPEADDHGGGHAGGTYGEGALEADECLGECAEEGAYEGSDADHSAEEGHGSCAVCGGYCYGEVGLSGEVESCSCCSDHDDAGEVADEGGLVGYGEPVCDGGPGECGA